MSEPQPRSHALIRMVPDLALAAEDAARLLDGGALEAGPRRQAVLVLRTAAEGFLAAGGAWSAADWAGMGAAEREAAQAAGEREWHRHAAMLVEALGEPDGAAALRAVIDGGESVHDRAHHRALGAAMVREAARETRASAGAGVGVGVQP